MGYSGTWKSYGFKAWLRLYLGRQNWGNSSVGYDYYVLWLEGEETIEIM